MKCSRDLTHLPVPYAVAIRLRAAGFPDEVIAAAVGIPIEGVGPLLRVAKAKLKTDQRSEA